MSVPQLFSNVKKFVKIRNLVEKAVIDNQIFRLHYRTTVGIFLTCSCFVTAYTMFGEPIRCIGDVKDAGKAKAINTYCYLGYTYTLPDRAETKETVGIGAWKEETEKKYHNYYRWVPLMLFLQGVTFYIPYWIWKHWENKRINQLTQGLRGLVVEVKDEDEKKLKQLAKYAYESLHTHNAFALAHFLCELLNLINVIVSMVILDRFLGGEFSQYGLKVLEFTFANQNERVDPMIKVFPRLTKCDFINYGPSGSLQRYDHMCLLALNNLNEKIYIFLWFWLYMLTIVSILPVVYNIALIFFPYVRAKVLGAHYILGDKKIIRKLNRKLQIGDFFLYHLLGKNMSSKYFREFIKETYGLITEEKHIKEKEKTLY